ncbi:MAG: RNA polymerase sigma factor [Ilumatobacteraceae bacterium]
MELWRCAKNSISSRSDSRATRRDTRRAVAARDGDRVALEQLIASLRDDVYRVALRKTGPPRDAEDAAQEVMLKIVTRLSSWCGEARITTWAHRITVDHLLNRRRFTLEEHPARFDEFAADLRDGLATTDASTSAHLRDEVRLGCTTAMLQCLDRSHRIAYILGELFDLPGEDAAWICNASHDTFRKRLSRARERVRKFMSTQLPHHQRTR